MLSRIFIFGLTVFLSLAHASEDLLRDAQQYVNNRDFKSAVIQLKNVLQANPESYQARLLLGKIYTETGNGESAEKELLLARKHGAQEVEIIPLLGKAYLLQRKPERVFQEINITPGLTSNQKNAISILYGNAYLMQGKKQQAENEFNNVLQSEKDNVDAAVGLAKIRASDNDFDSAEKLLQDAIHTNPENGDALLLLAEIKKSNKQFTEAKKLYSKILSIYPESLSAQIGKATTHLALDEMDKALESIGAIKKISPNHPMANHLAAVVAYSKKDFKSAKESLQNVLKVVPDFLPSLMLLGTVDYALGELQQSEFHLSRYVKTVPDNLQARKLLAAVYLKLNQPEESIKLLQSVANENMKDVQLLALLGTSYLQSGQADKGTEYLSKAVDIAPDTASLRTQLAMGQIAAGETEKALASLETAVDMHQDVVQADIMLVMLKMRQKSYDEVIEISRKMAEKMPESPLPYNFIGAAFLAKNEKASARENFNKALSIKKNFASAEINLAEMDMQEGNSNEAKNRYNHILTYDNSNLRALIALAGIANSEGNVQDMIKWLNMAKDKNKNYVQPYQLLVAYYLQIKDALNALAVANEANNTINDSPEVWKMLGLAQQAAGEHASAITTLKKLVGKFPESAEALYLLAGAQLESKDYRDAEVNLEKARSIEPENLLIQIRYIVLMKKTGKLDNAMKAISVIKTKYPDNHVGYQLEGDVYLEKADYKNAASSYELAYHRNKTSVLAISVFNAYSRIKGMDSKGREVLKDWLAANPDDMRVRTYLASSLLESGNNHEAVSEYETIIKSRPDDILVLNNMAWIYLKLNDTKSIETAERAYKLASGTPEVMDTYGWVLVNMGDVSRGLQILQEASIRAPHIPEIKYHMAVALYKSGRIDEARKELQRLLKSKKKFSDADKAQDLLNKLDK